MGWRKKLNSDVVAMETSVKPTRSSGAGLACKGVSRWIEETSLLYLCLTQLLEMDPLKGSITLGDTGPLGWGQFLDKDSAINFSLPDTLKLRKWVPASWSRNMMAPAFNTTIPSLGKPHTLISFFIPSCASLIILTTKINDHLLFLSWFDHPRLEKVSTTRIPLWHHNRSRTWMIPSTVQAD